MSTEIRIYVACLAAYNNGVLHGWWINADQSEDEIRERISAMLESSPIEDSEEWVIHDYEGFYDLSLSEYTGIDYVARLAAFLDEHEALGAGLVSHFGNLEDAERAMEEAYLGEYESLSDYAEEVTLETVEIPEPLRFYIDFEKMARDIEINDIFTIETDVRCVHVFSYF